MLTFFEIANLSLQFGDLKVDENFFEKVEQVERCNQIISNPKCNIGDKSMSAQMIKAFLDALYNYTDTIYKRNGRNKRQSAQIAQAYYDLFYTHLSLSAQRAIAKLDEAYKYINKRYGTWTGEVGNSKFLISPDAYNIVIPDANSHNNPLQKTIGEILGENQIDGILYKNFEPQFDCVSKAKAVLKGNTFYRYEADVPHHLKGDEVISVHERAFLQLAEQHGWTKDEAYKYKEENHLMWHECWDCETILLIPVEVHALFGHLGGVSIAKSILEY